MSLYKKPYVRFFINYAVRILSGLSSCMKLLELLGRIKYQTFYLFSKQDCIPSTPGESCHKGSNLIKGVLQIPKDSLKTTLFYQRGLVVQELVDYALW